MVGMTPSMMELCLEARYHMIVAGGDVPFLANASRKASEEARAAIARAKQA